MSDSGNKQKGKGWRGDSAGHRRAGKLGGAASAKVRGKKRRTVKKGSNEQ